MMAALRYLLGGATALAGTFGRRVPEAVWSGWYSLGGGILGTPTVELDGAASLEVFALGGGSQPYVTYQSNWGWNALGGQITLAPPIAMNFDGRLEIFGIGMDGNVYHNWQQAAPGPWSGWAGLSTPSNAGTTNGADMSYFVSDAADEAYYANAKGSQCPSNMPNMWRGPVNDLTYAWPCGAVVNTSFVGFDTTNPLVTALEHWDDKVGSWYSRYYNGQTAPHPAFLATYSGGPQSMTADRTCDTCIQGTQGEYGRGINRSQQRDPSNRLASVEIQIIAGITNGTALKQVLAHEIGHTFGLLDCPVNARDANGNALYDCSKTVMASNLIVSGHGWDATAKNATVTSVPSGNSFELLSGPSSCDMQIIDQNLPDYRQCSVLAENTPITPTCTNGAAVGFMDTGGGTGTYTCGGSPCDGCNSSCNNFAPQNCSGGNGGTSCPDYALCKDYSVFPTDYCTYPQGGCPENYYSNSYCCYSDTPILIDAFDEGFHLTNVSKGVNFRILPDQSPYQMSWPDPQWHNGWLALDRNGNGTIDDFTELFGNFTPQPTSSDRNGYLALALFDQPMNGGNANGVIDPGDAVYDQLRIWIDVNHDGVSQPSELHTLRQLGVFKIDLKYQLSRYTDANGNQFRYRARLWDEADKGHDVCYDVTLAIKGH
jgi:hypothetical protein